MKANAKRVPSNIYNMKFLGKKEIFSIIFRNFASKKDI